MFSQVEFKGFSDDMRGPFGTLEIRSKIFRMRYNVERMLLEPDILRKGIRDRRTFVHYWSNERQDYTYYTFGSDIVVQGKKLSALPKGFQEEIQLIAENHEILVDKNGLYQNFMGRQLLHIDTDSVARPATDVEGLAYALLPEGSGYTTYNYAFETADIHPGNVKFQIRLDYNGLDLAACLSQSGPPLESDDFYLAVRPAVNPSVIVTMKE